MALCAQLELGGFVSLHLRSRKFPSAAAYAQTLRVLAALYDRAHGRSTAPAPKVAFPFLQPFKREHLAEVPGCPSGESVIRRCMQARVFSPGVVLPVRYHLSF
jgi:hypothetical protein